MRESRTYGSVRGARGNSRPYRVLHLLLHLLTSALGTSGHLTALRNLVAIGV